MPNLQPKPRGKQKVAAPKRGVLVDADKIAARAAAMHEKAWARSQKGRLSYEEEDDLDGEGEEEEDKEKKGGEEEDSDGESSDHVIVR